MKVDPEFLDTIRKEMMRDAKAEVNIQLFFQVLNAVVIAFFLVMTLQLIRRPEKDYIGIVTNLALVALLLFAMLRHSFILRQAIKIFKIGEATKPFIEEMKKQNP